MRLDIGIPVAARAGPAVVHSSDATRPRCQRAAWATTSARNFSRARGWQYDRSSSG